MNNKKENPFTFLFQDVTWDTSEIQPTMDVQYVLLEPTFSDTPNADSCTSCPEGETTSDEGSTSSSQCGKKPSILF